MDPLGGEGRGYECQAEISFAEIGSWNGWRRRLYRLPLLPFCLLDCVFFPSDFRMLRYSMTQATTTSGNNTQINQSNISPTTPQSGVAQSGPEK